MIRSLNAAVSGIDANQTMLDVIGNNIANSNTTGYKSDTAEFEDLLGQQLSSPTAPTTSSGGINPMSVGSGVRVASIGTSFVEGSLEQTGVTTDVAITGNGFLIAQRDGQTYYTRAGDLKTDASGNITTADGSFIQGYPAINGVVTPNGTLGNLSVPTNSVSKPKESGTITVGGNLPAGATDPVQSSITVYDTLGRAVNVNLTFTPAGANSWNMTGQSIDPSTGTATDLWAAPQAVSFTNGAISSINGTAVTGDTKLAATTPPPGFAGALSIDFPAATDAGALTQVAGQQTAAATKQDGYASGTLNGFTIGADGTVAATFSNGQSQSVGQLATALFSNPGGLTKSGATMFQASVNSGLAQVGAPGSGGRGALVDGSLESSNVDLGKELTNLIIAQSAYQANTKVVSTSDQVLQSLVQMP
jgi:flagellar hook protein FlgE